ncbi:hypothetical protein BFP72_14910 [Reichenbachiella sp. 5M10]|uniref:PAS domain-containing sensor histidine kinase n=1 Tax=Reichenbachiella sp. 5M10 TaxID=1889772 RepID=UPI000C14DBDA|nr:PAS domain S-box protein [Reichenbachiella sp. 5M10]PIB36599.1 hypothetical protein BFP72_14910 [Reichenbachiella sp. 5M10]
MTTPYIDSLSLACTLVSILLVMLRHKQFKATDPVLFYGLLTLLGGYYSMLFLYIDQFEDILGALVPVMFAFVFYSMIQIHNNKKTEESEERLRLAIESTKVGLWDLNLCTYEFVINDAWFEIMGYSPEELSPVTLEVWEQLIHPSDQEKARSMLRKHIENNNVTFELTQRIKHKNGSWIWAQNRGKIVEHNHNGEATRMTGILIDMTAQKELELDLKSQINENVVLNESYRLQNNKLADNEKKYRVLYENSHDAIILIKDQQYFDCNQMAYQLFKCDEEYLIGKEPHTFSPEFQPDGAPSFEKAQALFAEIQMGNPMMFDWQHQRPNGELFDVSVNLNIVELDDVQYVQAVLRDITEKKRVAAELDQYRHNLERLVDQRTLELTQANAELTATMQHLKDTQSQLVQSEKMASLGILTAGIAHEINNPLNFIMGGYRGLEVYLNHTDLKADKDLQKLLHSIKTGADRAINIVKGLNQFSRTKESYDEDCDLHAILDNCLLLLNSELKGRIHVHQHYASNLPHLKGNVGKMHQIFINLITNAIHAIAEQGTITITTERSNQEVIIQLADTGKGIAQKDLPEITIPFFTTKEPGKGTGLGLSITYNFIQEHQGSMTFDSQLNHGTTVTVRFPLP